MSRFIGFEKFVCNPCQSSPSLTILVLLWFIIISLVFFHLCKALFSGFLQFKGKFVDGQNTSKYRDRAPLSVHGVFNVTLKIKQYKHALRACFPNLVTSGFKFPFLLQLYSQYGLMRLA